MNSDGYDDAVVGACNKNAVNTSSGRAYVYLGGAAMDAASDVRLDGFLAYEQLGAWNPQGAAYLVPNGFNRRVLMTLNLGQAGETVRLYATTQVSNQP